MNWSSPSTSLNTGAIFVMGSPYVGAKAVFLQVLAALLTVCHILNLYSSFMVSTFWLSPLPPNGYQMHPVGRASCSTTVSGVTTCKPPNSEPLTLYSTSRRSSPTEKSLSFSDSSPEKQRPTIGRPCDLCLALNIHSFG